MKLSNMARKIKRNLYDKGRVMNESEIKEYLKDAPKRDMDKLIKEGKYKKLEDLFHRIEQDCI